MTTNDFLFLDSASTTLVSDEILSLFSKVEKEYFANVNSVHQLGVKANALLNKARTSILTSFKCSDHRVIFTSCASEANNLAIKGYCLAHKNRGNHIITTSIEHPSVLQCFKDLEPFGYEVTILPVSHKGVVRLSDLSSAMRNNTILVSIMAVNNEIGSVNNISGIEKIVHSYPKAVLHVDTTQAVGKIKLDYSHIDMFVVSSHKIHGLKNSGALIARKNIDFMPLISGGGQEDGYRSGTQSVAMAVCLAKAIKLANSNLEKRLTYLYQINSYLRSELSKIDNIVISSDDDCSPYILNFSLLNKKASVVVEALSSKGIYVSTVSACHSKKEKMSYVLKAIGKNDIIASNSIRISLDDEINLDDINYFISSLKNILESIR